MGHIPLWPFVLVLVNGVAIIIFVMDCIFVARVAVTRETGVSSCACIMGRARLSCVGGGCCRCRSPSGDEGHEFGRLHEEFLLLMFQFLKELVLCCGEESSMFLSGFEGGF